MLHSLKIKIQDSDYIESIVEQDITPVEAEKIVGGMGKGFIIAEIKKFAEKIVIEKIEECAPDDLYCLMNVVPMVDVPGDSSIIANLPSSFVDKMSSIDR
ncbi:hypothetical protein KBT16_17675 [Nostoc sp. CCCryo 231-06]|nr:hypothetical protein [Nostoc sp. CCCryo 231-06]